MVSKETTLAGGLVRLFEDGDQWCALYGVNLQEGVAGFGGTRFEAVKALFKELGHPRGVDVRWLAPGEPDVYLGGGVRVSLARAIVMHEVDKAREEA